MATETFLIQIKQTGAPELTAQLGRVSKAATETERTLAFFRKALVAFSAIRAASGLVEFVDSAQRIDNRLRSATTSAEEFARAQQFIRDISLQTRTEMEANAQVYSRLLRSTQGLNFTTRDLEETMEALALAIQVGGSTSQEARNALIQFSQSLASGAVRGDELRSVAEQLPIIADAIGKEFGVAGGQLIAFAKANPGILESEKAIRGVQKALPALRAAFAQIEPTLSSAFTVVNTQLTILISDTNKATGIIGGLARGIIFLANNMQVALELTILFGLAWASTRLVAAVAWAVEMTRTVYGLVRALYLAATAQAALNLAVYANPYALLAAAIVTLIGLLAILYVHFEPVRIVVALLWQGIVTLAGFIGELAVTVGSALLPVFIILKNTFIAMIPIFAALFEGFYNLGAAIVQAIRNSPQMLAFFTSLWALMEYGAPILQGLVYLFGIGLYSALLVVMSVLTGIINAMALLGLVTQQTADNVNKAYVEFLNLAPAVAGITELEEKSLPVKNEVNDLIEKMEKNYRKFGDTLKSGAKANDDDAAATLRNALAKRELNKELKEAVKWQDMVTGRTERGWAAIDRLNGVTASNVSVTRDGVAVHNTLADALQSTGSSAVGAASGVNSLTSSIQNSISAANSAASAYSNMGSAASTVGATSPASITGSSFFKSSGTTGVVDLNRQVSAAEMFKAQEVTSIAQELYKAGKLSSSDFSKYMEVAADYADGRVDPTFGSGTPAIDPIYRDLVDKQNDITRKAALAAAAQTTSAQNFQTFWPWQDAVGFDTGGSFRVPGNIGSTDSVMGALRLSPGEEVEIRSANERKKRRQEDDEPPAQPIQISFFVQATDVDSFRRNQAQVESDLANAVARANRRSRK